MHNVVFFVTGLAAGIIGGMGMGGGAVLIPCLVLLTGISQHAAQGMNLIFFIPAAVAALYVHIKNKRIILSVVFYSVAGGATAAFLGSYLAAAFNEDALRKCFGVFLLIIGIYEFFKKEEH